MPSIAIIGTEGSGKTVLAAVLAKTFSQHTPGAPCLIPTDTATLKYVEEIYSTLSRGEWPPSTPSGTIVRLNWKLSIPVSGQSPATAEIQLFDLAGQDMRVLFEQEKIKQAGTLSGELLAAAAYCTKADVIIYLVNLKDFTGEGDARRRTANEAALKAAMDYLGASPVPRRVCFLFTQADQYRELATQTGGWYKLAQQTLPYVFSAHLARVQHSIGSVSAVPQTEIAIGQHGKPHRVPARGFKPLGMGRLMDWIAKASVAAASEQQSEWAALAKAKWQREQDEIATRSQEDFRRSLKRLVPWVVGIAAFLFIWAIWYSYDNSQAHIAAVAQAAVTAAQAQAAAAQAKEAAEVNTSWACTRGVIDDDITLTNNSPFTITDVTLTVNYTEDGTAYSVPLSCTGIYAGATKTWTDCISHSLDDPVQYGNAGLVCDQSP